MEKQNNSAEAELSHALLQFRYLYHYSRSAHRAEGHNPYELRPSDVMMLFTIYSEQSQHGSATATDLSKKLGIKTPSVNTVLSALEGKGLIERTTDPKDRRFIHITLSEAGRAQMHCFRECYDKRIRGLVEYLGTEKSSQLAELINEIYCYLREKSDQSQKPGQKHNTNLH